MKKRILLIALVISLVAQSALAATYTLGVGRDYTTWAAAIGAMVDGDTLNVYDGTYTQYGIEIPSGLDNVTVNMVLGQKAIITRRSTVTWHASQLLIAGNGFTLNAVAPDAKQPYTGAYGEIEFRDPYLEGQAVEDLETCAVYVDGNDATLFGVTVTGVDNFDALFSRGGADDHVKSAVRIKGQRAEIGYWYAHQSTKHGIAHSSGNDDLYVHHTTVIGTNYNAVMLAGNANDEDTYGARVLIEDCWFEWSTESDGVQSNDSQAGQGDDDTDFTAIVIRRTTFYRQAENAIDLKGCQFALIEYNLISRSMGDNDGFADSVHTAGGTAIGRGSGQDSSDWIIRYNIIIDSVAGVGMHEFHFTYHNTFVNMAYDWRGSNQTSEYSSSSKYYGTGMYWGADQWQFNNISVNGLSGTLYKNLDDYKSNHHQWGNSNYNLVYSPDHFSGADMVATKAPFGSITWATWTGYGHDADSIDGQDPKIVAGNQPTGDPTNYNFNVLSGSPAINAGKYICTIGSASGTSPSRVLTISDSDMARAFYDSYDINGEVGDTIYDDDGYSAVVESINRGSNTITISGADAGQFAATDEITTVNYTTAPDIGALQFAGNPAAPQVFAKGYARGPNHHFSSSGTGGGPPVWNASLSTDTNLVAWYEFSTGALTTDSSGNGNTLTQQNVSENSTQYQRGTAIRHDNSSDVSWSRILTGSLPADWPGHTGSNDVVSAVYWVYFHSTDTDSFMGVLSMYNSGAGERTWGLPVDFSATPDEWGVRAGYNAGASFENYYNSDSGNISTGQWYYVAAVIDGDNDTYALYVYDYGAAGWLDFDSGTGGQQHLTGNYSNNVFSITDVDFYMARDAAGGNGADITLDDVMIFKDALSQTEVENIRTGDY